MASAPPRLLPDYEFPPYSYAPGMHPHPIRDPAGHSHGIELSCDEPPDSARWSECRLHLQGLDLFNYGYYWESHEAWEAVWHRCRAQRDLADFFKLLIKLAAAGVKCREGRERGVVLHGRRAAELAVQLGRDHERLMGLRLAELAQLGEQVAEHAAQYIDTATAPVVIVFPFVLRPE